MSTYTAKTGEVEHGWYVVDAQDKVLGRLDTGDFIVVVNAAKLRVTGRKPERKMYYRHSGQPGQLRETTFAKLHAKKPGRVLQIAVKGMLPKGPLGYAMLKKLKVYGGATHPHAAQQPKALEI
jgi:large subunit ribosomal protein L13